MHQLKRFLRRLRNVVRPHDRDADLAREMSAHLTLLEDEYVRRGMPRDSRWIAVSAGCRRAIT